MYLTTVTENILPLVIDEPYASGVSHGWVPCNRAPSELKCDKMVAVGGCVDLLPQSQLAFNMSLLDLGLCSKPENVGGGDASSSP